MLCAFRQYLLFNGNKIIIVLYQAFFYVSYIGHLKLTLWYIPCLWENWKNKWLDQGHTSIKWVSQGLPKAVLLQCLLFLHYNILGLKQTLACSVHGLWMRWDKFTWLPSPVEKKGWHSHSLKGRVPQPLPWQAFIGFLIAYIKDGYHSLYFGLL